ncbi:MAG: helix-turn-helix domain-containing protein [Pararhodobacter sp.]|nr:helix-turn-helix domain-containing protein [Pararhodobacter sp.]
MAHYSIGDMARRTGVKVTTIRFYEARGLLPDPDRSEGGQRRYDQAALERLSFIRHARELGFELDDILELASLTDRPDLSCRHAHEITDRHLRAVVRRIAILTDLRDELERMLARCEGGEVGHCRVIEILGDHRLCKAEAHPPGTAA